MNFFSKNPGRGDVFFGRSDPDPPFFSSDPQFYNSVTKHGLKSELVWSLKTMDEKKKEKKHLRGDVNAPKVEPDPSINP